MFIKQNLENVEESMQKITDEMNLITVDMLRKVQKFCSIKAKTHCQVMESNLNITSDTIIINSCLQIEQLWGNIFNFY